MNNKFSVYEKDGVERIDFWNEHWYKIPELEDPVPSVTSIIGQGSPKDQYFYQWLRDTGNESKVILREASESGSRVHNAIENILLGSEVDASEGNFTLTEWKKVCRWLDWWNELGDTEVLHVESIVYSGNWKAAGTVDLIARVGDKTIMMDWKTGKSIHDSAHQQLAAYYYMAKGMGINIDEAWVVHTTGGVRVPCKVHKVDVKDAIIDFEFSLKTFDRKFRKKPPSTEFPLKLSLNN